MNASLSALSRDIISPKTILVTAIGSFAAAAVAQSLRHHHHRIIGCDIYPQKWHPVAALFDEVYQVPLVADNKPYFHAIQRICQQHEVNLIIPLTDVEVDAFNTHRAHFDSAGIGVMLQSADCLHIARDKYLQYARFHLNDAICVPETWRTNDALDGLQLPCVAKPRHGRSSEGFMTVSCQKELDVVCEKSDYLLQRRHEGPVYTVDYVRSNTHHQDASIVRKELIRTANGAGLTVWLHENIELSRMASYIGHQIGVHGCVNYEFIQSNGSYYLIDINPRFSAGVAFSAVAGYDMVHAAMRCFYGLPIEPQPIVRNRICAKAMSEMVLDE